jgi:hypothetical protein
MLHPTLNQADGHKRANALMDYTDHLWGSKPTALNGEIGELV